MEEKTIEDYQRELEEERLSRERANSGGDALLKLVNVLYDTDIEKLPQLTKINRREAFHLSIQIMKESILSKERKEAKIPLSKIWRTAYLQLMRSVDRWYFMLGAGLAHEQAQAEAEKDEEGGIEL